MQNLAKMAYEVQPCQYIKFIYKSDVEINHKDRLHKQMAGLSDSHQLERLALKPAPCFIGESCCWALLGKGSFCSSTKTSCAQKCLFPLFLEDKTNYSSGTSPELSSFGELQCQRALQRCDGWISSIWSTHANCAVLVDQSVQMPRPQSCCRQNVKILLLCLLCTGEKVHCSH